MNDAGLRTMRECWPELSALLNWNGSKLIAAVGKSTEMFSAHSVEYGVTVRQGGRSWRASGDRQISLNASAERAFANFRDKKHRILQLQIFAT